MCKLVKCAKHIPHSRKYWRSLNLAVWSRAAEIKILADLNSAVRYSIIICTYAYTYNREILVDFNSAVVARTAKPPNSPAIRYIHTHYITWEVSMRVSAILLSVIVSFVLNWMSSLVDSSCIVISRRKLKNHDWQKPTCTLSLRVLSLANLATGN